MSGFHAARRQAGGGNASTSGTTGSGAHSIVVISERGSRLRWRAVRTTLANTCWVSAPRGVRLPPPRFPYRSVESGTSCGQIERSKNYREDRFSHTYRDFMSAGPQSEAGRRLHRRLSGVNEGYGNRCASISGRTAYG